MNVLLIPAYLEPGAKARVTITHLGENGEMIETTRGTFDELTPADIWYLGESIEANFYIEGCFNESTERMADVIVLAILCSGGNEAHDDHGRELEERLIGRQVEAMEE